MSEHQKTIGAEILSKHYRYDRKNRTLLFDDVPQTLTKRQYQIIDLLSENIGSVVEFDRFRERIWDQEFVDNPTIRAEVSRLKKVLKEDFIVNVRAMGYMIEKHT